MTEQYDELIADSAATGPDVRLGSRTRAVVGLGVALVGLMGGGVLGNAVFFLLMESTYDASVLASVAQGLPALVLGLAGAGLGWTAASPAEPVATPAGRAAVVLGVLAALGAVAVMVAGQA